MQIIEARTYERYVWDHNGDEKYAYICVPVTIVTLSNKEKYQTHFIFWN